jgi:hypothetical protein|tara:strand:- start:1 stop:507 length:507 start_codon:yes stop_codon:yes gene_type:complete
MKKSVRFSKDTKQRIIDEYLASTGLNTYRADEFVDWLANQPEHEAYAAFYGMTDEHAARQYRIDMARDMASGLRIVAKTEVIESGVSTIKVTEYPAYISPVKGRKDGGGYEPFDPSDEEAQAELRRQAGVQLAAWLNRYRGSAENIGLDMTPIEDMVRVLRDEKEEAA